MTKTVVSVLLSSSTGSEGTVVVSVDFIEAFLILLLAPFSMLSSKLANAGGNTDNY